MTTLAAGKSSASRARQAAASWRASMAGPFGASGVVVTTTTSDSRAETIASGARVVTKCSMLSQIRCRCAAPSPGCGAPGLRPRCRPAGGGSSNAIATTLWSRAGS